MEVARLFRRYRRSCVNDEFIRAADNARGNAGLTSQLTTAGERSIFQRARVARRR